MLVWFLILSILWGTLFVWLPQGFATLCIHQYSWRATFAVQKWYGQELDRALNSTITNAHKKKKGYCLNRLPAYKVHIHTIYTQQQFFIKQTLKKRVYF